MQPADKAKEMKEISKAILELDEQRKMKGKLKNVSYAPWKNPKATVKETPFGNFPGEKKKPLFDFSKEKSEFVGEQASTSVRRIFIYISAEEGGGN